MDKGIEALINKPIHQERRFQFVGKKQIEYWAEIDAGAYKYLPESERRIVYSELEVEALIAALEQAQQEKSHLEYRLKNVQDAFLAGDERALRAERRVSELEKTLRGTEESLIAAADQVTELEARTLSFKLPDPSSKAFWGGSGKNETFYPSTYKVWVADAIERAGVIAGIKVEVK